MTSIDPAIMASRVRAALAYADIHVKGSHRETGIGDSTMTRIVSSTSPRGASSDEMVKIADACGVPLWFLRHGFTPPVTTGEADLRDRLDLLERQVQAQLSDLEARLTAPSQQDPRDALESELSEGAQRSADTAADSGEAGHDRKATGP